MIIELRVRSKTVSSTYHTVVVDADADKASVGCTCPALSYNSAFCAHVDAVLVAQETVMLHDEDQD